MNATADAVLKILMEREGAVSGAEIGAALGISRSAVSKHTKRLRAMGYRIESVPRRGHRLLASVNVPYPAEVTPHLTTTVIGRRLLYFDQVDSTNAFAAKEGAAGAEEGTVVVADAQSAGRGRLERTWVSPSGCNLYATALLRPAVLPSRVSELGLVAAVAIHRALVESVPEVETRIKWPNDILVGQRKLCGILCESELESDRVHYALVGIGINVNMTSFPPDLRRTATSLALQTKTEHSRPTLLASVLNSFEEAYDQWKAAEDLSPLLGYLRANSALTGRRVTVRNVAGECRGRVAGISPAGELVLMTDAEQDTPIASGDVLLNTEH